MSNGANSNLNGNRISQIGSKVIRIGSIIINQRQPNILAPHFANLLYNKILNGDRLNYLIVLI